MKNLLVIAMLSAVTASGQVFVEAEEFAELGGWVVDQQFANVMGSPYLLAHGTGTPVGDAVTRVKFGEPGDYRLFVRTRDWVAPQGPGRFRVQVGGWLSKELGVGDGNWHWEDCGTVKVGAEEEVRLRDLTGFEGRVDALAFTRGEAPKRPDLVPVDGGAFGFVVVGGGFSGMCAAVAAARLGVKTALVQDRPRFGGNGSNECRVRPLGRLDAGPFPRNADLMNELNAMRPKYQGGAYGDRYRVDDDRIGTWLGAETNLTLFISTSCLAAEKDAEGLLAAVVVRDIRRGRLLRLRARYFCDATGDAALAEQAGARTRWDAETFEETGEELAPPKGRRRTGGGLESSLYWFASTTDSPKPFPACPWALRIDRDEDALVGNEIGKPGWIQSGGWNWGSGYYRDPVKEGEAIRDWNFRSIYGTWDYLKNRSPYVTNYVNAAIYWMGHVLAKRDAHRILGDYVVTANDMLAHRVYPDGVVTTTWYLDLHFPHPSIEAKFPDGAFRAGSYDDPPVAKRLKELGVVGRELKIEPYPIPLRCLYSKDVPNLFAAGKDISGTYAALASYRVENTCGMTGTVVGRAAALCLRTGATPRQLAGPRFAELAALLENPK